MDGVHGNQSFSETTPSEVPISRSPGSFLPFYPNPGPIFAETSVRSDPFDQTLESALSHLSVSTQRNQELVGYPGHVGGEFLDGSGHPFGGGLPRTKQERNNVPLDAGIDGVMRVGLDIDSRDACISSLNGNGYLLDSRTRRNELFNEFSRLPSSNQNGFLAGAAAAGCSRASSYVNNNVMRSGFSIHSNINNDNQTNNSFRRPHWLREPLDCSSPRDMSGRIVALAKNHYGSRFLQRAVDEASEDQYLLDSRTRRNELFNEFSELTSSSQSGFLAGAAAAGFSRASSSVNKNVMGSSFNSHSNINNDNQTNNSFRRPQWYREQLNCLRLRDMSGRIVALATDRYGSKFLQRNVDEASKEEIDMIFMELIDHVAELMIDPYANYVVQKVLDVCSDEQKIQVLLMVVKDGFRLVNICLNVHGSIAVLKLLEKLTNQQQVSLVMSVLSPGAVALTKDVNGRRVIHYCLKTFSDEDNKYLLNEVAYNCYRIATDRSGCCALQDCVDHSKGEARVRLVREIIENALELARDQYGNYVVQHVLGLKEPQITESLLRQLEGNYASLSCNRYGSNVVEMCLEESGEQQCTRIIRELLRSPSVSSLLVDPSGNYVIQTALKVSKGFAYSALLKLVRVNYQMMCSHVHGRWVRNLSNKRKPLHM